jgi:hypothetical protein
VVVRGQSCRAELRRLLVGEHPKRATRFHAQATHHADHRQDTFERRALGCVAPGGAHAEAGCALRPRASSRFAHLVERDEILARDSGGIARRLRAVRAIFRTSTGLDAQQNAALNLVGAMVRALHLLRPEDEV